MTKLFLPTVILLNGLIQASAQQSVEWKHFSSKTGDIDAPNTGGEQTSAAVADFNNDGINDFCISERQQEPSMVVYFRNDKGWAKFHSRCSGYWLQGNNKSKQRKPAGFASGFDSAFNGKEGADCCLGL